MNRALLAVALVGLALIAGAAVELLGTGAGTPALTLGPGTQPAAGAELAPAGAPIELRGAGVRLQLPAGFQLRPGSISMGTGATTLRASGPATVAAATFYTQDPAGFRDAYRALAGGAEPAPGQRDLLLGEGRLLSSRREERPGGELLVFELEPAATGWRTLAAVALPQGREGLATLNLTYEFSAGAGRQALRILETVGFPAD